MINTASFLGKRVFSCRFKTETKPSQECDVMLNKKNAVMPFVKVYNEEDPTDSTLTLVFEAAYVSDYNKQ